MTCNAALNGGDSSPLELIVGPLERTSLTATLTELEAVQAYANAWASLDFSHFVRLLDEDARYASQYVFEELVGKTAIENYLSGKAKAVKSSGASVTSSVCSATRSFPGKPCVLIRQGVTDAVVFFEVNNGRVHRFDLCITQLFEPVPAHANQ